MHVLKDLFLSNNLSVVSVLAVALVISLLFGVLRARANKKAKKALEKMVTSGKTEAYALHPKIDPVKCSGCGICTRVCPEGDILQMVDGVAHLVGPTKCVGHSLCFRSCPVGAITMVYGTEKTGKEVPHYDENYETNVPGLYIAGELGGMGLIANAIKQGTLAAAHAVAKLDRSVPADIDVLVVGAGPAGIAASLKCIELRAKFRCIDQNSFGGTVLNFPRQKLVMSHPATLPLVGKMSFPGGRIVKEDLLKYWADVCKRTGLHVEERVRFAGAKKVGNVFEVETSVGVLRARKVILAVGVGGTPRKLGLPNEDSEKVAFQLSDPEQYQNHKIAVVGAGDSAVEAAQRVAAQKLGNTVHLLVRGDALTRCKDANRLAVEDMERRGLLKILYETQVKEIHPDRIVVESKQGQLTLPNDYLILFMGTVPPFDFLRKMGIGIRTLYGEPLT